MALLLAVCMGTRGGAFKNLQTSVRLVIDAADSPPMQMEISTAGIIRRQLDGGWAVSTNTTTGYPHSLHPALYLVLRSY